MLRTALLTSIPLLGVSTDDPLNAVKVIRYSTEAVGKQVLEVSFSKTPNVNAVGGLLQSMRSVSVGIVHAGDFKLWKDLFTTASEIGKQIIVVNPPEAALPYLFDCGQLDVPDELIRDFVKKYANFENIEPIMYALRGLNLKQVLNVSTLASAEFKEFTATSVLAVRRKLYKSVRGLIMVDSSLTDEFYQPSNRLIDWLSTDGMLFLHSNMLQPRGLLLEGRPGTGKTMGAKFLANQLGVPLYKLDVTVTLDKYVGESEKNLALALRTAEQCAPCVLLLDEIDKLFATAGDAGATSRSLSVLLWWLQEHRSKVVTIMTSNHSENIPEELYRRGRIDAVIRYQSHPSIDFMLRLHCWWMQKLGEKFELPDGLTLGEETGSEADLTQIYIRWLKGQYLKTLGVSQNVPDPT